jgi:hypothetical protein
MKKKMTIISAIAVLVGLGAAAFLFLGGRDLLPGKEPVLDQTNKVFVVKGDVKVKKAGENAEWQKVDSSTVLEKGDVIQTAGESSVDIVIGSQTDKSVKIEENSRTEFEGINPAHLNLSQGKIMVRLKKLEPRSSFTVKTPTAMCGARGTGWSEQATPAQTKICVFENDVFVKKLDASGRPEFGKHITNEGTQRIVEKDKPVSQPEKIGELDKVDWKYWDKNVTFLREGKILVNDFSRKENFNNLGGPFGSWNIFYSDPDQYCRDEFSEDVKAGDSRFSLKLTYDVDTQFSAYNGFFTNLMGIDISGYRYLIFYIKGDREKGFTTKVNLELKNHMGQIGRMTLEGITDEWQKISVNISKFIGITNFKDIKEFVIVFSDIGVTKKEGVIYIDDIYFAKDSEK